MKKKLCLMLASIMVVSMLAACGNGGDSDQGSESGERPEGVQITMGRKVVTNAMLPEGQDVEENALIWKTEKELKIDIVDEFNGVDSDYDQKVSMAMTSGSIPDIMRVSTQAEVIELYENGMIMDMTEYYEEYANDAIKAKYDSYPAGLGLDRGKIDGGLYALPAANGDVAPIICFMRSDWIDEIGLTVDEDGDRVVTYQEIIDVAKAFKDANVEGVENPLGLCINEIIWREGEGAYGLNFIANAFNAWPDTWFVKDGELVYGSVQDEVKDFLKVANQLYEDGILDAQVGTREFDAVTETMVNGQFGMCFGAGHCPNWGLVNVYAMNNDADYKCFLVSDLDGVIRHKHSDSAETGFIVVSSECEYPEVAVEILNLWFGYMDTADKDANLFNDESVKELDEMGTDFAVGPYRISLNFYTDALKNTLNTDKWVAGELTDEEFIALDGGYEQWVNSYKAFKANEEDPSVALDANDWKVYTSRFEAYSLLSVLDAYEKQEWLSPEFPAITDSRWATLKDLQQQTYLKMIKGEVDIDAEWDNFVQQWNDLGGAEITADAAKSLGL